MRRVIVLFGALLIMLLMEACSSTKSIPKGFSNGSELLVKHQWNLVELQE